VKWQNDKDVTNCPICGAPFNVVTRKHHCRLCGRVVCFLPPNTSEALAPSIQKPSDLQAPSAPILGQTALRSSRCSTFVLYDRYPGSGSSQSLLIGTHNGVGHSSLLATGSIREVDLGDFPPIQALASLTAQERDTVEAELDSKRMREMKAGVRVCRECLNTVWKRQKKSQPKREEPWLRLYNALREIQQDIENALPLLSELGSLSDPTVEAVKQFNSTRQTLLKSLSSYDLLAKRIRDLPASAGSPLSPPIVRSTASGTASSAISQLSSSQERLQRAIYNHAMLFLGEKMAVIKGMGGLSVKRTVAPARASTPSQQAKGLVKLGNDAEDNKAEKEQQDKLARLAVLYE
jgi:rabenosyn-5